MKEGMPTWYSFSWLRDRSRDSSQLEVAAATYCSWILEIRSFVRPNAVIPSVSASIYLYLELVAGDNLPVRHWPYSELLAKSSPCATMTPPKFPIGKSFSLSSPSLRFEMALTYAAMALFRRSIPTKCVSIRIWTSTKGS